MMRVFSRLRRRIALRICPELGPRPWLPGDPNPLRLERWMAPVGAVGMAEMDLQSALSRVFDADDIGAEAWRWLEDCRAENRRLGGDDGQFMAVVIALVAQITLPIGPGGRK